MTERKTQHGDFGDLVVNQDKAKELEDGISAFAWSDTPNTFEHPDYGETWTPRESEMWQEILRLHKLVEQQKNQNRKVI